MSHLIGIASPPWPHPAIFHSGYSVGIQVLFTLGSSPALWSWFSENTALVTRLNLPPGTEVLVNLKYCLMLLKNSLMVVSMKQVTGQNHRVIWIQDTEPLYQQNHVPWCLDPSKQKCMHIGSFLSCNIEGQWFWVSQLVFWKASSKTIANQGWEPPCAQRKESSRQLPEFRFWLLHFSGSTEASVLSQIKSKAECFLDSVVIMVKWSDVGECLPWSWCIVIDQKMLFSQRWLWLWS